MRNLQTPTQAFPNRRFETLIIHLAPLEEFYGTLITIISTKRLVGTKTFIVRRGNDDSSEWEGSKE